MSEMWHVMCEASAGYDANLKSRSGLVGGSGKQMENYMESGSSYCGEFMLTVVAEALKMGESNACMKRIVAARIIKMYKPLAFTKLFCYDTIIVIG